MSTYQQEVVRWETQLREYCKHEASEENSLSSAGILGSILGLDSRVEYFPRCPARCSLHDQLIITCHFLSFQRVRVIILASRLVKSLVRPRFTLLALTIRPLNIPAAMSRPQVVFVLGRPGSGKGTQCLRICQVNFALTSSRLSFTSISQHQMITLYQSSPSTIEFWFYSSVSR